MPVNSAYLAHDFNIPTFTFTTYGTSIPKKTSSNFPPRTVKKYIKTVVVFAKKNYKIYGVSLTLSKNVLALWYGRTMGPKKLLPKCRKIL